MDAPRPTRLTSAELDAETATPLPDKEVLSLLDLKLDLDLALDLAAPIDLAVAANANAALPIDAAVAANVGSLLSTAGAVADQDVVIDQFLSGEATATGAQTSAIDQGSDVTDPVVPTDPPDVGSALDGDLLNVDVDVALDADLAAPIAGAVALNANVAAPIDAAVAANILSVGSEATAIADQDAMITQTMEDVVADATADQDSTITQ